MRTVRLPGSGLETSAVGLGTAGLFREPSRARRRRLLERRSTPASATSTSPRCTASGWPRASWARFARGRRDELVIATKFGIDPTPAARLLARAQARSSGCSGVRRRVREPREAGGADPRAGLVGKLLYRGALRCTCGPHQVSSKACARSPPTTSTCSSFTTRRPASRSRTSCAAYLESARPPGSSGPGASPASPRRLPTAAARLGPEIPVLQLRDDVLLRSGRRLQPTPQPGDDPLRRDRPGLPEDPRACPRGRVDTPPLERRRRRRLRRRRGRRSRCCSATRSTEIPRGPVLFGTIRPTGSRRRARAADGPIDPRARALPGLVEAEVAERGRP